MFKYLTSLFAILIVIDINVAFETGAPTDVCQTMTPKHYNAKPQLAPSPYQIRIDSRNISLSGKLQVTIDGTEPFKGFILQARDAANNILGQFESHSMANVIDCPPGEKNAITHNNSTDKYSVVFTWKPDGFTGQAFFLGTVVKTGPIFWVYQRSPTFNVHP